MTPSLYLSESCTVVTVGASVLTISARDDELKTISLTEPTDGSEHASHASYGTKEERIDLTHIGCASLSDCGKWFAACTGDKKLYQWQTDSWILSSVRKLNRNASSVKFTPSAHGIVVADKTGDAYLYSVLNSAEDGQLLLGHLSMLLDVIVSPCENFIITCDRDEKIRVSRFPNAYNIHSYCLGHEDFVSKIAFYPNDKNVLVSGSGDGSIRFWDYLEGKQIGSINCSSDALSGNCAKAAKNPSISPVTLAVTQFSTCQMSSNFSILAVSLTTFRGCILYHISGNRSHMHSVVLQILAFEVEPWDILANENQELWFLAAVEKSPVTVQTFGNSMSAGLLTDDSLDCKSKSVANHFNSQWTLFSNIPAPKVEPIMHKRRHDDLQEYKERKQQRLANKLL